MITLGVRARVPTEKETVSGYEGWDVRGTGMAVGGVLLTLNGVRGTLQYNQ